MHDIFIRKASEYIRELNILENAQKHAANYLSIQTKQDYDICLEFVKRKTDGLKDSGAYVRGLKKAQNGDRYKTKVRINRLLEVIKDKGLALSASFVVYMRPDSGLSPTGNYITSKKAERKVVKKTGFEAEQKKDELLAAWASSVEYKIKVFINSISGARASNHNSLHNPNGHSTLTSCTRTEVSYSNACTEKFISGNRHYYAPSITIDNIISIVTICDYVKLQQVVAKYNLYIPTPTDVYNVITRCTKLYFFNDAFDHDVRILIGNLTDLQRAAFVYTGDFYHLTKFNKEFIFSFIEACITPQDIARPDDYGSMLKDDPLTAIPFISICCYDILAGKTISDIKANSPEKYRVVEDMYYDFATTLEKYQDLLVCLFSTDNLPHQIYSFPSSIRRSGVGGDTDSTMYTVQQMIIDYFGELDFSPKASKISALMNYLNIRQISHAEAQCCRQFGVIDEMLFELKMKNELSYLIYIRTPRAKHYGTYNDAREGNIYASPKVEIKGVGLLDSKLNKFITVNLERLIKEIMMRIVRDKCISIEWLMYEIATIENSIFASLQNGEIQFYSMAYIGSKQTYVDPMKSKYIHYDLWENVFAPVYGHVTDLPYRVVKLNTLLLNPRALNDWCDTFPDDTRERLRSWIALNNKTSLKTLYLPMEIFADGIPDVFKNIVNMRYIVCELMYGYYLILESCGFFIKYKNPYILLSDTIKTP